MHTCMCTQYYPTEFHVLSQVFMETDARLGRAVGSLAPLALRPAGEQSRSERHQKRFRQQMLRTEPRTIESTSTCCVGVIGVGRQPRHDLGKPLKSRRALLSY